MNVELATIYFENRFVQNINEFISQMIIEKNISKKFNLYKIETLKCYDYFLEKIAKEFNCQITIEYLEKPSPKQFIIIRELKDEPCVLFNNLEDENIAFSNEEW
jgi:hypothetical protein